MKKVGLLLLALVLALGGLGVGYAMWYQTLTISGNVSTGSVSWEFCNQDWKDNLGPEVSGYVWPGSGISEAAWIAAFGDFTVPNGFDGDVTQLDKNVSWGTCRILNDEGIESAHGKTIEATLHEVYPCNYNDFTFYVYNSGTLPIVVDNVKILDNNGVVQATLYGDGYVALDLNDDDCADIEINYGDHFGYQGQIEPGDTCTEHEFSFSTHVLQCAPQGQDLTFSIMITAVQWNEYGEEIPE